MKKEEILFQRNLGHEVPAKILDWKWSPDFGRWSALVVFKDGYETYTYPKNERWWKDESKRNGKIESCFKNVKKT